MVRFAYYTKNLEHLRSTQNSLRPPIVHVMKKIQSWWIIPFRNWRKISRKSQSNLCERRTGSPFKRPPQYSFQTGFGNLQGLLNLVQHDLSRRQFSQILCHLVDTSGDTIWKSGNIWANCIILRIVLSSNPFDPNYSCNCRATCDTFAFHTQRADSPVPH